jgi:hypothetical protein
MPRPFRPIPHGLRDGALENLTDRVQPGVFLFEPAACCRAPPAGSHLGLTPPSDLRSTPHQPPAQEAELYPANGFRLGPLTTTAIASTRWNELRRLARPPTSAKDIPMSLPLPMPPSARAWRRCALPACSAWRRPRGRPRR